MSFISEGFLLPELRLTPLQRRNEMESEDISLGGLILGMKE
jgi:hypothetical protein